MKIKTTVKQTQWEQRPGEARRAVGQVDVPIELSIDLDKLRIEIEHAFRFRSPRKVTRCGGAIVAKVIDDRGNR